MMQKKNLLYIISSPSGAGKTSISNFLLQNLPIKFCVSATTRTPRAHEKNGDHYIFIDEQTFDAHIEQSLFVEHATVFQYRYGTYAKSIDQALTAGQDLLFDMDWQGARQMRLSYPHNVVSIFIVPPSIEVLQARLEDRGHDSAAVVAYRMQCAQEEMKHWKEYDYIVINNDFEQACQDVLHIFHAEKLRKKHQHGINETFLHALCGENTI